MVRKAPLPATYQVADQFGRTRGRAARRGTASTVTTSRGAVVLDKSAERDQGRPIPPKRKPSIDAARKRAGAGFRTDKRLRFGAQTDGWWYMVRGPVYWRRAGTAPETIDGYLYKPGRWMPFVNVGSARSPVWAPASSVVPADVRRAAGDYPHGKHSGSSSPRRQHQSEVVTRAAAPAAPTKRTTARRRT